MKITPLGAFRGDLCVWMLAVFINFMFFETETSDIRDSLKFNCVAKKPIT